MARKRDEVTDWSPPEPPELDPNWAIDALWPGRGKGWGTFALLFGLVLALGVLSYLITK